MNVSFDSMWDNKKTYGHDWLLECDHSNHLEVMPITADSYTKLHYFCYILQDRVRT